MKKKIVVINHQMELGGVGIAAKNFIENMKDDYEIKYVLARPNGDLVNRLPINVKVSYIPYPLNLASMTKTECIKKSLRYFIGKIFLVAKCKIFNKISIAKKLCSKIKSETEEYDLLINNDMDMDSYHFGACHVYAKYVAKAKLKIFVLHGDFLANNYDSEFFKLEFITSYDYIVLLSYALKEQLDSVFPDFKEKFIVIPNFAAVEEIKTLSRETEITFEREKVNIVSASRLTELKGIIRSLKVFKKLKEEGFNFYWHILGDGEQRSEIEQYIKENELEDNVKLWGLQNNPYPYMKAADMLYLGSYHESYGLVLVESMIVGRPVVTTNTASAKEVVDEKYGWVCDNNEEGIYNAFKEIFSNPKSLKEKTRNLKNYEFDNESIKRKYDELIGR